MSMPMSVQVCTYVTYQIPNLFWAPVGSMLQWGNESASNVMAHGVSDARTSCAPPGCGLLALAFAFGVPQDAPAPTTPPTRGLVEMATAFQEALPASAMQADNHTQLIHHAHQDGRPMWVALHVPP